MQKYAYIFSVESKKGELCNHCFRLQRTLTSNQTQNQTKLRIFDRKIEQLTQTKRHNHGDQQTKSQILTKTSRNEQISANQTYLSRNQNQNIREKKNPNGEL